MPFYAFDILPVTSYWLQVYKDIFDPNLRGYATKRELENMDTAKMDWLVHNLNGAKGSFSAHAAKDEL